MGHVYDGSDGSWVTKSDPWSTLMWILKGDSDDSLKWPISGKLTLTLSNHDTPEHNHTLVTEIPDGFFENPSTTKNDSYGFPKFLHLEQMLNPKYCRNNYITLDVKYEL